MVSHELLRFRRACSRFFHRFIRISSLLTRLLRLLSLLNLLLTDFRDVSIRCIIYDATFPHDFYTISFFWIRFTVWLIGFSVSLRTVGFKWELDIELDGIFRGLLMTAFQCIVVRDESLRILRVEF